MISRSEMRRKAIQKPEKRFWFNWVEEMVMNPKYAGYRYGRVEVFDNTAMETTYDGRVYEASFLLPAEIYDSVRDAFDFKETDLMPRINWDAPLDIEG